MKNNCYIFLFIALTATLSASAQMHNGESVSFAELATGDKGSKQKSSTANKAEMPPRDNTINRTDKRKWAIQIKQGEKWYQLSVSLVF